MNTLELCIRFNKEMEDRDNWTENGFILWNKILSKIQVDYIDISSDRISQCLESFREVTEEVIGVGVYNDIRYEDYMMFFGKDITK